MKRWCRVLLALVLAATALVARPVSAGAATGPALSSFGFTPRVVATENGPGTMTFTAGVTSPWTVSSVYVQVRSAASPVRELSTRLALTAGTARDGTWRGTLTLPRGSTPGVWHVNRVLFDNTSGYYTADALRRAGFPNSFTVTGTADSSPPTVSAIVLSQAAVDATYGPQVVTVRLHIRDDRAGVAYVSLQVTAPGSRPDLRTPPVQHLSGTARDGMWSANVPIAGGAVPGSYALTLQSADVVGNTADLSTADLAAAGLPSTIAVTSTTPAAPTGVSGQQVGGHDAVVSWTRPPETSPVVSSYEVTAACAGVPDATFAEAAPRTQTYVRLDATAGACTFTVVAANGSGRSPRSAASPRLTLDPTPRPGVTFPSHEVLEFGKPFGSAGRPVAVPVRVQATEVVAYPDAKACSYTFQRQTDTRTWTELPGSGTATRADRLPGPGSTYQYRVRANGCAGVASSFWAYGPRFGFNVAEEDARLKWTYSPGWSRTPCDTCSGGFAMQSAGPGQVATFTSHQATNLALVALTGQPGNVLRVYVDGIYAETVYPSISTPGERAVVFNHNSFGPERHVLQVVDASDPGSQPVAIDAVLAI